MHPGPMNRGVEIDSAVADDPARSLIREQVEMGVVGPDGRAWTCCPAGHGAMCSWPGSPGYDGA